GTTGTKVMVFDHEVGVRARAYAEHRQIYPQPGWVEHDPAELWQTTHRLCEEALSQAGIAAADVVAIGITNQRETVVVWDRATGEPAGNAIVWQDRRTADQCDELKASGLDELVRAKTGLVIDPYFSATKLRWFLDHNEGARERARQGELAFGTVDSWLVWKLTGGTRHLTDYSNASRTMLYNIVSLEWDAELLDLFDIPREMLPSVEPSSAVYGLTYPDAFFGATVPIAGIAGDQQAALFGQTCFEPGQAKNTYGTGSFVLLHTGEKPAFNTGGMLSTIAWRIRDEPVEYALEGAVFITGAAIQWLRDGLGIIEDAAETEALAASLTGNDDVYFVPALAGLGAPHWDPFARGCVIGLTRGTTRAHFVRAALESICYQSKDVIDAMERASGVRLREVRVDGGAVANGFLMQFQADILGVPVDVPSITETTSLGAAYLAGLAVGFWENRVELAEKWKLDRRYEPAMSVDERNRLHGRWRRAVDLAKGWAREPVD
ncbi:MAG: glycerol kinase GlpK, partial [Pyrinomonadaceae bacterium]